MLNKKQAMQWLLAATLCAGFGARAIAQSATDGAVGGTVQDKSGSTLAGANVLIHSNATAAEQTVTTDAQGYFRAIHLTPGQYTVTITEKGFETYKSNLTVEVGVLTNVDAVLPVGGESTVVEVNTAAPEINTTSPDFANVIDSETLRDLPVNNYRWSSYALLTPGVVADANGFGLLSFRGQSTLQNNITIDGADDNQAFFAEERGRTRAGYSTAQVAIQEFQVNTSNYTTEYGRAVGGVVNSITKSGGNTFHGDLYFRDRDAGWGASNPYTTIAKQNAAGAFVITPYKPKDWRKQFGGGVGGPIWQDKVFFFLAADKFIRNFPGTAVSSNPTSFFTTPDAALPAGIACNGTGAAAPSAIDASVCQLGVNLFGGTLATLTPTQFATASTNYTSGLSGLNTMLGPVARTGTQSIFFPKIDWQINTKNHAAVEVNRLHWASPAGIQTQATNTLGIASFGNDYVNLTFGVAKLDTAITNSLSNEVRYQYGRDFEFENNQVPTPYEQANVVGPTPGGYTNPLGLPPSIAITNGFTFGTATFLERPRYPDERRWQISDTANWTHGKHNVKFGLDFVHTYDLAQNLRTQYGSYSFTSLTNYFTDFYLAQNAATAGGAKHYSSYQQAFGPLAFDFTTKDYGFFAQDEWKVLPRLSLTIGARYDYEALPTPFAALVNPALPQTAYFHKDTNNIAPRVGFAWDVYGNGKTALRGGAGVFYGRIINSSIYSALTSTGNLTSVNGTPVSQVTFSYTSANGPAYPQIIANAGAAGTAPSAVFFDKNFQNPYVYQGDLTLQQDMGWNTFFSVSWLGSMGRELPQFVDVNLPAPTGTITYTVVDSSGKGPLPVGTQYTTKFFAKSTQPTTVCLSQRPNCNYGALTDVVSNINTSYNALAAQLIHRMSNNLSFQLNYTWSHALNFGENNSTFTDTNDALDPTNPRGDYGNSNQNVPNRLVTYVVYQTPKFAKGALGWLVNDYQVSPSYSVQSGLPYSAATSGSPTTALTSQGVQNSVGGGVNGSNGAFRIDILGRNQYKFPTSSVLDLRLSKHFIIYERFNLEIMGETFNLMNHQNVTAVNTLAYSLSTSAAGPNKLTFNTSAAAPLSPLFGTATNSNSNFSYSPRQIQLGAKLHF